MYTIKNITKKQLNIVQKLAYKIWPICYKDILSAEQISYMLQQFYSLKNLENIHQNHHKFIVIYDVNNQALGFASFQHNCDNTKTTKLHKLYVLTNQHKKGLGKKLLQYVINNAIKKQQQSLFLNVNRQNPAISFYTKNEFQIIKNEDITIGNGYLMEDYVMQLKLHNFTIKSFIY